MAETRTNRRPPKKKSRTGLIVGIVLAVLLGGSIAAMLLRDSDGEGIVVETEKVQRRDITQTVYGRGTIDPETQLVISSEVSGEIVFLGAKEGDVVQKGQVLVKINPQSMLAQQAESEAAISAAQARLASAKAGLLRQQTELARVQQLFDKNLSTRQELDNAKSQVQISEAEVDAAGFTVDQARANARMVRESLNKTTIRAPISGTIVKLNSKVGEKVVGAIQMTGTEIMTIADLSVIESVVDVSENDVVQVKLGDTATVEVDAIANEKFQAYVSQIANSPKQTGLGTTDQVTNFEVRVRFVNPDPRLRPGMTATATVKTATAKNVLSVPLQSVTTRDENKEEDSIRAAEQKERNVKNLKLASKKEEKAEPMVFVKSGDTVVARKVEYGIRDDQYYEIKSGLNEGEEVVSGGYKAISKDLENGSKVRIELESEKNKKKGEKK
ncbi:MAG: efflux RND transporter periplasmic adaptor subunit [Chlorobi bacterium]|nr:MAG: HlyD family secretion protein [Chlorobi bacterium OLB7]MBK8910134.1 efflux RND transporter periplasmic adaptor subunit [Chlorobiota bacterium]MBX7217685.1 efflux RND transporter periplasmic adaptor subunit [Candidatus Kapabacteria bacterium]